jgi:hypothetical protein
MKLETAPITDDEWLLRRVHQDRFKTNRVPIHSPNAFAPRTKGRDIDEDGISLFREACLGSADEILAQVPEEKRKAQGIVRIQAKTLREIGLTIESKPIPEVKGHVVIPELNCHAYTASKDSFTSILEDLAELTSRDENIVLWPKSGD